MIRSKRIQSLCLAAEYRRFLDASCGPLFEIAERNEFDALGVHWCSSKKDRYYYAEGFHFLKVQFVAEDVFSGQPKAEI